jgi:hypothetical protein
MPDRYAPTARALAMAALTLLSVACIYGQDVLTIGTVSAPSGGVATIPVYVRDLAGTALGSDAGTGNRIQGIALKVTYPASVVASASFTRSGATQSLTPLYDGTFTTSSSIAWVGSFEESSNPIPLTLNAAAPGNQIGTLSLSLKPEAFDSITLTLDAPSATLSNQAGSVAEKAGTGLSLVNGRINVTGGLAAPTGLVATASGTSQVNLSWLAVGGANHYDVFRSVDHGAFASAGTAPAASFADTTNVQAGKTYLYQVRAVNGGTLSAFSTTDAATTIVFTEDPLLVRTTRVRSLHFTELLTAVNAMRRSAGLSIIPADPTVAAGLTARAAHVQNLRDGLAAARSAIGLPALTFTNPALVAGSTAIMAIHVQEIRNGVK